MKIYLRIATALAAVSFATGAQAVFVADDSTTPRVIGSITAGQSYTVTATGVADLLFGYHGAGVTFTADGIPTYAFTGVYSPFYPSGLDYDPSQSPTAYGIGGVGRLYGALLGTFSASPTGPADYFVLGSNYSFTAPSSGTLYGIVNDCSNCYTDNDNERGFSVTLALATRVAGVPEPATWAMMLLGFGGIGIAMRRSKRGVAAVPMIA